MRLRNSLLIFGCVAACWSCVSTKTRSPSISESISLQQIEQIALGAQSEEALKVLGAPKERRSDGDGRIWIYDSIDGQVQRAALGFNKDNKLVSKTFIPKESEPESRVAYLLKSKFPKIQFRSVTFPQCGMDYISGSALFVDDTTGVSILYRKEQEDVEAIGWATSQSLNRDMADIENCVGRGRKSR